MSLKSDYNDFITYKDRLLCDKTTKYWINQEERYIEPFQIFGNLLLSLLPPLSVLGHLF